MASTPQMVISGMPATRMLAGERSRVSRWVNGKKTPAMATTRKAIAKPRKPDRIVLAGIGDVGLQSDELVAGLEAPLAAQEVLHGPVAVGLRDDRDHELAGDVAADDHSVGPVELGRGEELQPAALRRVHIGDEVNAPSCHSMRS